MRSIKKGLVVVWVAFYAGWVGFLVTNWEILALQWEQEVPSANSKSEPSELSICLFWSVPYSICSCYYLRIDLPLLLLLSSGMIILALSLVFENIQNKMTIRQCKFIESIESIFTLTTQSIWASEKNTKVKWTFLLVDSYNNKNE